MANSVIERDQKDLRELKNKVLKEPADVDLAIYIMRRSILASMKSTEHMGKLQAYASLLARVERISEAHEADDLSRLGVLCKWASVLTRLCLVTLYPTETLAEADRA